MATNILMPALSPTMEEGKLAKWLVKEGDTVKSGTILAEIETDKATMEFEAVDEGRIGKILVPEGSEGVKVNAPIAVLLDEGEKRRCGARRRQEGHSRRHEGHRRRGEERKPAPSRWPQARKPRRCCAGAPKPMARASSPRRWPGASPPSKGIDLSRAVAGTRPARPHRQVRCRECQARRGQACCRGAPLPLPAAASPAWRRCRMRGCSIRRAPTKRPRTTPCARPSPSA